VLGENPSEVAKFLIETPGLDKSIVGSVLGDEKEENIKILHAFVDSLDFTGLSFTTALRRFLQVSLNFLLYTPQSIKNKNRNKNKMKNEN